jgi:hypothetical protein
LLTAENRRCLTHETRYGQIRPDHRATRHPDRHLEKSDAPAAAVELSHSQLERLARLHGIDAGYRRISARLRAFSGR